MGTFKSLLVATDFSAGGRDAARRAMLLATEQQARLSLLHVMSGPNLDSLRGLFRLPEEAGEKLVADARRELDELAADIAGKNRPMPAVQVRIGRVLDEILAATEQADLLVLGARGWNPVRDAILGSTAERLLRKSPRPVLVTRRAPQGGYQRVLVPVDFSPSSAVALETALRIAPAADITVVHAFDVPFEGKLWLAGVGEERIQEYRIAAKQQALNDIAALIGGAGDGGQRCFRTVEHGDAVPLILAEEARVKADLIVIGKRGRSMIEETLLGSVTRHVLSGASGDVLVVNEQSRNGPG